MNQRAHEDDDQVLIEAADWFAKARGPDAARWASELAAWRLARPENDAAYDRLLRRWDQSAFLNNSALVRGRDLRSVAIWSRRPAFRPVAIAAGLLAAVGLATMAIERSHPEASAPTPIVTASADRAIRTVALQDGGRAILDAGSAIEIRTVDGSRIIRLVKGRARFDVSPNAAAFSVEANGGRIACRGGVFDVAVSPRAVTVAVWRGHADVRGGGLQFATWSSRIMPGQQLSFGATRSRPVVERTDPGQLGWTRGMLSFERTRLADAVAAFNRYNATQIILSPYVGDLRVTGAFHASDPEDFARVVSDMFDLPRTHRADGSIALAAPIKT